MEYIDGTKISKLDQFSAADKKKIAKLISTSILNQIIRDGFFHADPHPGNILVKDKSEVYFIDFGLVGILNERIKEDIRKLFIGIGTNNSRLIVESLTTMNKSTYQKKIIKFEKDIDELLDKYLKTNIGNIKIDEFFGAVTKVASKYRITIISEFFLISKCLTTLQQIVESLDPGLNIYEIAKPIVKNIHVKKVDLDEFKSEIMQFAKDYKDLFTTIPYALINFIKKMQDDDYSVGVKITNTKRILRIVNSATNRISFSIVLLAVSIIIAGVIIGNSFSTGSTMDPFNRIVQTVGLILAVIIVVGLAISIFRSFKNK